MRRLKFSSLLPLFSHRAITIPWESKLPNLNEGPWNKIGSAVTELAISCDTGKVAFEECSVAREQLELIARSVGYDMNVYISGGLVTMGILEVGGDVDFVGVTDVEPDFSEAGDIVLRLSREMKRLGLRTTALPRARVPIIKADRVTKSVPGTPIHSLSTHGIFQFLRPLQAHETESFENLLRTNHGALTLEWNQEQQVATVQFSSSSLLMHALTHIRSHNSVDIPFRIPVDVKNGPEIYRLPFDFSLSSTGLRNTNLLSTALDKYPYSRHLLLALKKWGRASGVINSIDGLLASYAFTLMLTHLLVKVQLIPPLCTLEASNELQVIQPSPVYRPLAPSSGDMQEVGYLLGCFLEYYGSIFNYSENVLCTSNVNLTKKEMSWDPASRASTGRPPFFEFGIKDPYSLDNIGRNLDLESTLFVKNAHAMGLDFLIQELNDEKFVINKLVSSPPTPERRKRSLWERGVHSDYLTPDQLEARHVLKKMEFHERRRSVEKFGRKTQKNFEEQQAVSNVTKNVLGWIRNNDKAF